MDVALNAQFGATEHGFQFALLESSLMEKRKPLTRRQFGFLILRQNCLCGCGCGAKLDFTKDGAVTDEHVTPIFSTPKGVDPNRIENRALWLTECSKPKTIKEAPGRAKVRRIEGKKTQADKRAARKASGTHTRWPKRKLESRPFGQRR